jgi:hypothetical protein
MQETLVELILSVSPMTDTIELTVEAHPDRA